MCISKVLVHHGTQDEWQATEDVSHSPAAATDDDLHVADDNRDELLDLLGSFDTADARLPSASSSPVSPVHSVIMSSHITCTRRHHVIHLYTRLYVTIFKCTNTISCMAQPNSQQKRYINIYKKAKFITKISGINTRILTTSENFTQLSLPHLTVSKNGWTSRHDCQYLDDFIFHSN